MLRQTLLLPRAKLPQLQIESGDRAVSIAEELLSSKHGAIRDVVLANAAVAIGSREGWDDDLVGSLRTAIDKACVSIDSGADNARNSTPLVCDAGQRAAARRNDALGIAILEIVAKFAGPIVDALTQDCDGQPRTSTSRLILFRRAPNAAKPGPLTNAEPAVPNGA